MNDDDITVLPDGSAFELMSFPLPENHWIYDPYSEEWDYERDCVADTPQPIFGDEHLEALTVALRWAIRGATMRGQAMDFDPDALVLNALYAICGPANASRLR